MAFAVGIKHKGSRPKPRLKANIFENLVSIVNQYSRSLYAEFLGTFIFQLIGGATSYAPYNGSILAICIYMTAKSSGGVLNPGVATSLYVIGKLDGYQCISYIFVQLLGAVIGAMFGAAIDLNESNAVQSWGFDSRGPGCAPENGPEMYLKIFSWECLGMFVLASTVLSTAISKPGFGDIAPIAIGLSMTINISASGSITGGCYNPARFFGPALAMGCRLNLTWLYFGAHLMGSLMAAASHCVFLENYICEADYVRNLPLLVEESNERKRTKHLEIVCPKDNDIELESPTDVMQSFSMKSLSTPMSAKSQPLFMKLSPLSAKAIPFSTRSLPRSGKNGDQHNWGSYAEMKLSPTHEHRNSEAKEERITPLARFSNTTLISRINAGITPQNDGNNTPLAPKSNSRPV